MKMLCPFKMAGGYGFPSCDDDCMLYMGGKCAIAVIAENGMDRIAVAKDGADNER